MTVKTRLIYPVPPSPDTAESIVQTPSSQFAPHQSFHQQHSMTESTDATAVEEGSGGGLSVSRLKGHDQAMQAHPSRGRGSKSPQTIVVRIEVHDTGVGIKPRDMIDNRVCLRLLFDVNICPKSPVKLTVCNVSIVVQSLCSDRDWAASRRQGEVAFIDSSRRDWN